MFYSALFIENKNCICNRLNCEVSNLYRYFEVVCMRRVFSTTSE